MTIESDAFKFPKSGEEEVCQRNGARPVIKVAGSRDPALLKTVALLKSI
jgi:hypothetical protein